MREETILGATATPERPHEGAFVPIRVGVIPVSLASRGRETAREPSDGHDTPTQAWPWHAAGVQSRARKEAVGVPR